MAKTELFKYTEQEKLNKMDIDLIDVELTTLDAAIADDEVISQGSELQYAVSVPGGTGVIQSIVLNSDDNETPAMDLVFTQVSTAITDALSEVIGNNVADLESINQSILGHVSLSNYTDLVDCMTATKLNVGLIIKAAEGSTSIYVHTINRSGANFTPTATDDLHLRVGIVKD